ncbi:MULTISPECIES: hypothetical protein [unclassified Microcoleus]|uniref:hypothetical protein n=1 Tax=unclassified Microcoleus TaxID=2642155 RepID=UPI002FD49C7F
MPTITAGVLCSPAKIASSLDRIVIEMTSFPTIRAQAIALIDRLPTERLTAVVQLLEFLAEPSEQTIASQEASLLQIIQHCLPVEEQKQLESLRERGEWGELTEAEQQELIGYEDLLEQQRVERLKALIQLAKLRNIDLTILNNELKEEPLPCHAI